MVSGDMATLTGSHPRVGAVAVEGHPRLSARVAQRSVSPRPEAPPATATSGSPGTPVTSGAHPAARPRGAAKQVPATPVSTGPSAASPPWAARGGPTTSGPDLRRGKAITPGKILTGSGGWFGGLDDPIDPGITASGIPESQPGMATYYQSTLGGYWLVTAPNGRTVVLQQTDVGPAPWTGRAFDFTYSALPELGYTETDIPTGTAHFSALYLGDNPNTPPRLLERHP
ncbi:MAG TPA: hypothetical protein VE152_08100 [Acidimicrobiales bacterium]|nr:hypothetical protein [Acidimicrobiales bacterium]